MYMCDRSEDYFAGEWPTSRPGCFTLRGNSPYIGAGVGPTTSVDVLAKRNVTAPAGYRTRFCGLPSRSQDATHTELSRLCIVWILREFCNLIGKFCVTGQIRTDGVIANFNANYLISFEKK